MQVMLEFFVAGLGIAVIETILVREDWRSHSPILLAQLACHTYIGYH